jgi:hypothetical protein
MDEILDEKSLVNGKEPGVLKQTQSRLEGVLEIEQTRESWWSILIFWIHELRWRRVFWEKMGHPPKPEVKP